VADQQALKHALQNLLENAYKYGTNGHKWIGVSAASIFSGQERAVEIRVVDRGPGIPREERDHIFDSFFRGRQAVNDQVHGTGLGLNLVKKIVEAHGGTIRVESQPNLRTEFIVTIPAAPPQQQNELTHSID
jgi:signal transduction histidine kinase